MLQNLVVRELQNAQTKRFQVFLTYCILFLRAFVDRPFHFDHQASL